VPCEGMATPDYTAEVLQNRLTAFAARVLRLSSWLPQTYQAQHIAKQLTRSSTALAANYGEVRGAESRADFIHKLRIVLKELNETEVWLNLVLARSWFSEKKMSGHYRGKPRTLPDHRSVNSNSRRFQSLAREPSNHMSAIGHHK